ncbi:MAG: glycoside hydrolase family 43 protein [Clostridia bacterium]|nr:glycoside hydrolase family 43 protein [Clostridia bacterium]
MIDSGKAGKWLPAMLLCLCLIAFAGCGLAAQVKFRNVSLHDPAVLQVDGQYYFYGSHMQAAVSEDLVQFRNFSKLDRCTLQPNYAVEFKEALAWAKTGTFWAPDVIRLRDGRYYMYYCCCEGSSPLSALGLAVSDSPAGPFENIGILLRSGEPGYDATQLPNAIDPCVFWDADGTRLYMVYGSYSGGIFLLELDPETGLILDGQTPYGIHLLGGNHSCIEAPYIVYHPGTGYYYLFLSFGGLNANDGYNIRVCRSRTPEGPYEDAAGNSMPECRCRPGNFFNNDDIAPYGTKLMGGYLFSPLSGENSGKENAVRSPGHNSVLYDAGLDAWLIFHHTRFAATGERYILEARRLYFNDAGWPMISPVRYTPVPKMPVCLSGKFKALSHGSDVNRVEHISSEVQFLPDEGQSSGKLQGSVDGEFQSDGNVIRITAGSDTYSGFVFIGYDDVQDAYVTCFTALSETGEALWGMRATGQD